MFQVERIGSPPNPLLDQPSPQVPRQAERVGQVVIGPKDRPLELWLWLELASQAPPSLGHSPWRRQQALAD